MDRIYFEVDFKRMKQILFKLLQNLIKQVLTVQWKWYACGVFVTIVCVIYNAVKYPEAALNLWICRVIDMFVEHLPSTPDSYKIGNMMSALINSQPVIGSAVFSEIFSGVLGMLSIYLVWKVYRSLPFI